MTDVTILLVSCQPHRLPLCPAELLAQRSFARGEGERARAFRASSRFLTTCFTETPRSCGHLYRTARAAGAASARAAVAAGAARLAVGGAPPAGASAVGASAGASAAAALTTARQTPSSARRSGGGRPGPPAAAPPHAPAHAHATAPAAAGEFVHACEGEAVCKLTNDKARGRRAWHPSIRRPRPSYSQPPPLVLTPRHTAGALFQRPHLPGEQDDGGQG